MIEERIAEKSKTGPVFRTGLWVVGYNGFTGGTVLLKKLNPEEVSEWDKYHQLPEGSVDDDDED